MRVLIAMLIAACLGSTASAQIGCPPMVVLIEEGVRVDFVSADPAMLAALDTEAALRPEGSTMFVISKGKPAQWAPPDTRADELAVMAATDDIRYEGPTLCRPKSTVFKAGVPVEGPQPKSGRWRAEVGPASIEGCPAQFQDMIASRAGILDAMDQGERTLQFSPPFHPSQLEMSEAAGLKWKTSGKGWITNFVPPMEQAEGASSDVTLFMQVTNPDRIDLTTRIVIKLPAIAAAMLGVGPQGCRIDRDGAWIRIAD